jgi:ATP-binding cassette subfamily C (CFTR/MRP) protein 1
MDSVDFETDKLMQNIIRTHFSRHTVVAVVHRLETILDFDKIVFLEAGQIIEMGQPTELLSRPSAFRDAYNILKGGDETRETKL